MASTIEAKGAIDERRLAEAFDRLDSDDSGYITVENLRGILGEEFPQSEIDQIIAESDLTHDGRISYFEFLAQWQDQREVKRQEVFSSLSSVDSNAADSIAVVTYRDNDDKGDDSVDDPADLVARANFLESKQHSERKATVATSPTKVSDTDVAESEGDDAEGVSI